MTAPGTDRRSPLCAFIAVALAAAARLTPDVPRANLADEAEGRTRGGSMAVALRVQPRLRGVLAVLLLVYIGIIASFTFLPLRIVALGGSPSDVALSASVSAFAEIPAMLLTTAVAARVGLRGLMAGSALLYGACFVAWAVVGSPMLIVATRLVSGFAIRRHLGRVRADDGGPPARRLQATGQGLYQVTAFGIAAVVANFVGGQVYAGLGSAALFGGAAILAVVAAVLALAVFPHRRRVPRPRGRSRGLATIHGTHAGVGEAACGSGADDQRRDGPTDGRLHALGRGRSALALDDVAGSIAHVRGLGRAGLLDDAEVAR